MVKRIQMPRRILILFILLVPLIIIPVFPAKSVTYFDQDALEDVYVIDSFTDPIDVATWIKFDVSGISAGQEIVSAYLSLYCNIRGGAGSLGSHELWWIPNQTWDESDTHGYVGTMPRYNQTFQAIVGTSGVWHHLNVLTMFDANYNNGYANFTIRYELAAYDFNTGDLLYDNLNLQVGRASGSPQASLTFYSSEYTTPALQPYLTIISETAPLVDAADILNEPTYLFPGEQYTIYQAVTDPLGASDLDVVQLYISSDHTSNNVTFQFDEDTGTFSQPAGSSFVTLDISLCSNASITDGVNITWVFTPLASWVNGYYDYGSFANDTDGDYNGTNWNDHNSLYVNQVWLYSMFAWEDGESIADDDVVVTNRALTVNGSVFWYATDQPVDFENTVMEAIIVDLVIDGENLGGDAFLPGWSYRKQLNITGSSSGAIIDHVIKLDVHNITGTDSGDNVFLGSKVESDFGDVRFTDSGGKRELEYWIHDQNEGANHKEFWVEVPSIAASPANTSIYIYYGNSGATTTSNGTKTFTFFDDFSSGTFDLWAGDTGDFLITGETLRGSVTDTAIYAAEVNATDHAIDVDMKLGSFDIGIVGIRRQYGTGTQRQADYGYYLWFAHGVDEFRLHEGKGGASGYDELIHIDPIYFNTSWVDTSISAYGSNLTASWANWSYSATDTTFTTGQISVEVSLLSTLNYWDNFRLRPYIYPEPTLATWGTEDTYTGTDYHWDEADNNGFFEITTYTTPSASDPVWSINIVITDPPTGTTVASPLDDGLTGLFLSNTIEFEELTVDGASYTLDIQPDPVYPKGGDTIIQSQTDIVVYSLYEPSQLLLNDAEDIVFYWKGGNEAWNTIDFFIEVGYPLNMDYLSYNVTVNHADGITNHAMSIGQADGGNQNVFNVGASLDADGDKALSADFWCNGEVELNYRFQEGGVSNAYSEWRQLSINFTTFTEDRVATRKLNNTAIYDVLEFEVMQDNVDIVITGIDSSYTIIDVYPTSYSTLTNQISSNGNLTLAGCAKGSYVVEFDTGKTYHDVFLSPTMPDGLSEDWQILHWFLNTTYVNQMPYPLTHGFYQVLVRDAFDQNILETNITIASTDERLLIYDFVVPIYKVGIHNNDDVSYYLEITRNEITSHHPLPGSGETHFRVYGLATPVNYTVRVRRVIDDYLVAPPWNISVPDHSISYAIDYVAAIPDVVALSIAEFDSIKWVSDEWIQVVIRTSWGNTTIEIIETTTGGNTTIYTTESEGTIRWRGNQVAHQVNVTFNIIGGADNITRYDAYSFAREDLRVGGSIRRIVYGVQAADLLFPSALLFVSFSIMLVLTQSRSRKIQAKDVWTAEQLAARGVRSTKELHPYDRKQLQKAKEKRFGKSRFGRKKKK